MAHNGIVRSHRLSRLLRKHRTRQDDGVEQAAHQSGDLPSRQPVPQSSMVSSPEDVSLGPSQQTDIPTEVAQDHLELALEKRQQSPNSVGSQTAIPTSLINDSAPSVPLDTTVPQPTSTLDPGLNQPTGSNPPADTTSVAVPATSSLDERPTPSPALPSLTADTPTVTSVYAATVIPTVSVSLSLDVTAATSISIQTSNSLINPVTSAQSSVLVLSSRPSSIVLSSSTPTSRPKTTASTSSSSNSSSSVSTSTNTDSTTTSTTISTTTGTTTGTSWSDLSEATATGEWYGTGTAYLGGGGYSATGTGEAPAASTDSSSSPGGGGLDSVTTKRIVGGVVGGLAGAFSLLALLLFMLRRRKTAMFRPNRGLTPREGSGGPVGEGGSVSRAEMASRRSSRDPLWTASYFAPAFVKRWRQSNQTVASDDSTFTSTTSERGFQKISGRKIPSVLQSGGDGYGGGFDQGSPTTSEPSMNFQSGSPVQPRSPISQPPPSMPYGMPLDVSYTRETDEPDSVVVFRPSPARTPVASSTNVSMVAVPAASRAVPQPLGALSPTRPQRPDVLGRSHPSFDGSRGSRFTESLDGL
ncbi:uncharacterized protein ACLA_039740 [Aspergillus clavatus NRRL 1]|uniref:Uncharacterized protein n=1 Tax=Aspergillus clavatus (strain ATCC 1007 / CBS 513.65 / DSM 816 / NCTC 3887 / NRRL 1 / QM 1276 / 107) TaxID=344612 RepID=A1CKT4_ASPCL|nr:uncharacterized protein ACLA_039740 [Aspergillus clavatus NRRL 1]EAW09758.1 conserved hypothetical protein [Aspergillus clavatus NRRL 1]